MIRQLRAPLIASVVIALVLFGASKATWAAPGPYTVDADGIRLTVPLEDSGHVNIDSSVAHTDLHAESKCANSPTPPECSPVMVTAASLIGATFIPWSAFGPTVALGNVTWVQVSGENFHWTPPTTPPTSTPTATPTGEPSTSVPSMTPSSTPKPSLVSATPTGTPTPVPTSVATVARTSSTATPSPTTVVCCAPTLTPEPTTEGYELAVTGTDDEQLAVFGLAALALVLIGVFLMLARKLHDRRRV